MLTKYDRNSHAESLLGRPRRIWRVRIILNWISVTIVWWFRVGSNGSEYASVWASWRRQLKYLINAGNYLTCPPCNWIKRIQPADAMRWSVGKQASKLESKLRSTLPVPAHSASLNCSTRWMRSVMFVTVNSKFVLRTRRIALAHWCSLMWIFHIAVAQK